jgi:hypothetical protein
MNRTTTLVPVVVALILTGHSIHAQDLGSSGISPSIAGALAAGAIAKGNSYLEEAPEKLEGMLDSAKVGQKFETEKSCLAHLQLAAQFGALARNTLPFSDVSTLEDARGPVVRIRVMLAGERTHVELSCNGSALKAEELPWGEGPPEAQPLQMSSLDAGLGALFVLQQEGAFESEDDAGAEPAPSPPPLLSNAAPDAEEVAAPASSEEKGLTLALQRCWNVPAGLRDAQDLHVRVGAELGADGSVINSSIHFVDPTEAPDGRTSQLYEAARRALIRCAPYSLPRDKYAEWRELEITVNPEGVVSVR